jgi:hypothetical protein
MVEGRNRPDDPLDASRIAKWTKVIDAPGRETLAAEVGRLAEFLGYSVDDPEALAPLAPEGRHLITGAEMDARTDCFADLDLRAPGLVPRYEQLYHPREWDLIAAEPDRSNEVRDAARVLLRAAARPLVRPLPGGLRRRLRAAARRIRLL